MEDRTEWRNGRLTIIFLNAPFAAVSYKDLRWGNVTNFYACNLSVYIRSTYIALAFPN